MVKNNLKNTNNWQEGILSDFIIDIKDGGTPSRRQKNYFGGNIPWVVIKDIKPLIKKTHENISALGLKNSSAKLFPANSIILSFGATIGEVGITTVPVTTKQGIAGIIPDLSKIQPKYLYYLLLSKRDYLNKIAVGSTIKEVRPPIIKKIKVSIPPIPEQEKIVEILKSVDDEITKREEIISATEKLKSGLMQKMFASKGINTKLSEIATIVRGGSPRPIEDYITDDPDGLNWLKIGDIEQGAKYINRTGQKIKKSGLKKTTMVHSGDFILSNSMSFGRPYIMKIDACIHDGWLTFKDIKNHLIDREFLYYLLSSKLLQNNFTSIAAGSGVKNLKRESVANIIVKLPPIDKQKEIATILSSIDDKISTHNNIRSNLLILKKGLMQDLLTGKIRTI